MSSITRQTRRGSRWAGRIAAACFTLASVVTTGCIVETSGDPGTVPPPPPLPPPVPAAGSLTLRWTVNQTTDPNSCVLGNASTLDVVLATSSGQFAGEYQASCGAFATTIPSLTPGNYTGTAQMLDAGGRARTTVINISAFTILENSTLVVDLSFPANSFL
jgi:hypothetical protein